MVMWRLRYKLSLRDLAEMFLVRGITFTHETVRLWEARFAPLIMVKLKAERKEHLKKNRAAGGKRMRRTSKSVKNTCIYIGR